MGESPDRRCHARRASPPEGHKNHPLPLEGDASSVAMKGDASQGTPGQGCSRREPGQGRSVTASAWLMACLAMVVTSLRVPA